MGAQEWFHIVEWMGSEEASLRWIQDEILASDQIFDIVGTQEQLLAVGEGFLSMAELSPDFFDAAAIQEAMDQLSPDGRPATREHAVLFCAENLGTGTILDVDGIRTEPRSNDEPAPWGYEGMFLSPLPAEELVAFFGSETPDLETLAKHGQKLATLGTFRGDGRYVVGYDGGEPAQIAFVGASGD